ncbi:hypothetical protein GTR02_12090 [Kineococcus sp. R8]|uniref:CARDB domain-containing protein n=1 Tax=Kineococcus siccus TaxID=2696567 RepID=UPI0014120EE2|nr:CARDB domain-containing protein [Kineococcus siccus]NAZ82561.1 hypothetical protein [Kineococcus siccus]
MTATARRSALVAALTGLGLLAGAAGATAAPVALPDLVVSGISAVTATPGAPVTFAATLTNRGRAATPAGVVQGVAFAVDGTVVTWSASRTASLAPGASAVVRADGGPRGATWTATAGRHVVTAVVDDVARIRESDERNNTRTRTVTVPVAAGATGAVQPVTAVTARQATAEPVWRVTHDDAVTVSWTVPAGQPAGTTHTVVEHATTPGSSCAGLPDTAVAGTTTGTSLTVRPRVGDTCSGHGQGHDTWYSVTSTAPSGAKAVSAASGACAGYRNAEFGATGPVDAFTSSCAGGADYADHVQALTTGAVRVDAGSATGTAGYAADRGFTGGQSYASATGLRPELTTSRWGWSSYRLPVAAPGRYLVRLHLVDPTFATAGRRVFDVAVNGTPVRTGLDIAATVGRDAELVVDAYVDAPTSSVEITATRRVDNPIVASIEVLATTPGY